jgi:hypothetical protein
MTAAVVNLLRYYLFLLFTFNFVTLSVVQIIQCRMTGWLTNYELGRMSKKKVPPNYWCHLRDYTSS